jgi:hypothetical protein
MNNIESVVVEGPLDLLIVETHDSVRHRLDQVRVFPLLQVKKPSRKIHVLL